MFEDENTWESMIEVDDGNDDLMLQLFQGSKMYELEYLSLWIQGPPVYGAENDDNSKRARVGWLDYLIVPSPMPSSDDSAEVPASIFLPNLRDLHLVIWNSRPGRNPDTTTTLPRTRGRLSSRPTPLAGNIRTFEAIIRTREHLHSAVLEVSIYRESSEGIGGLKQLQMDRDRKVAIKVVVAICGRVIRKAAFASGTERTANHC